MNKEISSVTNPIVKHVVRLHASKGRKEFKQFIAEGARVIATFLENGFAPQHIFLTSELAETELGNSLQKYDIFIVTSPVMQKMSSATSPSGILAVFQIPEPRDIFQLSGPAVVLAGITDPGNMGSLIRSAAALNFSIFAIDAVDIWSPKVVQASAGALALQTPLPVSWQDVKKLAQARNMQLYAMVVSDGVAPEELHLGGDTILVLGSEAHGIPERYVADCDGLITLSMPGRTESLNVAIAGSIGMYVVVQKMRGKA